MSGTILVVVLSRSLASPFAAWCVCSTFKLGSVRFQRIFPSCTGVIVMFSGRTIYESSETLVPMTAFWLTPSSLIIQTMRAGVRGAKEIVGLRLCKSLWILQISDCFILGLKAVI